MKKCMMMLLLMLFMLSLTMCTTLHSVSLSQIPKNRNQNIYAEAGDWAFLGINFSNDIVEEAQNSLRAKCPNGKITGILTKFADYNYLFVVKREVTLNAFCVSAEQTKGDIE
ncbi:MAG: hypothetical protein JXK07_01760 [Spirochaetes bacterium]|nr:hypothetical protein [Spirochaetota bacterium]MBN2772300.1 hypothetical protein [Spirochaetota bacterium]